MNLFLIVCAVGAILFVLFLFGVVRSLLCVAEPNEALIFVGSARDTGPSRVGYRIVRGGRGLRKPMLEVVHRMDLTMFTIDVIVQNAYSRGGIPLNVIGVANVKVAGEEPLINNAIERFLGKPKAEIMRIAKETLEGNLRGVLAQLTPEEVNEDKVRFAQTLIEEAEHDMSRMGLTLETLKVQNVSDDVGYLGSIGRIRGSVVRQQAAVAEAQAKADAAVNKASNDKRAELAKIVAELEIARQQMKTRIVDAKTKREATIAESYGQVAASVAQAKAEIQKQIARAPQVRKQLEAEVIAPADADRRAAEEKARGDAAPFIERARAQAQSLRLMIEQLRAAGPAGREILALQKLLPLSRTLSGADSGLRARKVSVLPTSNGTNDGTGAARALLRGSEEIRAATGVDLISAAGRLGQKPMGTPPPVPTA